MPNYKISGVVDDNCLIKVHQDTNYLGYQYVLVGSYFIVFQMEALLLITASAINDEGIYLGKTRVLPQEVSDDVTIQAPLNLATVGSNESRIVICSQSIIDPTVLDNRVRLTYDDNLSSADIGKYQLTHYYDVPALYRPEVVFDQISSIQLFETEAITPDSRILSHPIDIKYDPMTLSPAYLNKTKFDGIIQPTLPDEEYKIFSIAQGSLKDDASNIILTTHPVSNNLIRLSQAVVTRADSVNFGGDRYHPEFTHFYFKRNPDPTEDMAKLSSSSFQNRSPDMLTLANPAMGYNINSKLNLDVASVPLRLFGITLNSIYKEDASKLRLSSMDSGFINLVELQQRHEILKYSTKTEIPRSYISKLEFNPYHQREDYSEHKVSPSLIPNQINYIKQSDDIKYPYVYHSDIDSKPKISPIALEPEFKKRYYHVPHFLSSKDETDFDCIRVEDPYIVITNPEYVDSVKAEMDDVISQNSGVTTTITSWSDGYLDSSNWPIHGSNGHVYFPLGTASTKLFKFLPDTDSFGHISDNHIPNTWKTSILGPDNSIYMFPNATDGILKLNIDEDLTTTISHTLIDSGSNYRSISGYYRNKKFYFCPATSNQIMVDNVLNNQSKLLSINGAQNDGYISTIQAFNGHIYYTPFSGNYILKFNPHTNSGELFGSLPGISGAYGMGSIIPSGFIYCPPYLGNDIIKINTNNDTYEIFGNITNQYFTSHLGPDGKIYCPSRDSNNILVIDPSDDSISEVPFTCAQVGWDTSIMTENAMYAFTTSSGGYVLKIAFDNLVATFSQNLLTSKYMNN